MHKVLPVHAHTVPDHAKRVFKGVIFDVYQWPQTMFDSSTATFEMLRRPDTVLVIAVKDGKLLATFEEQPGHTPELRFPGGRTDEALDESWLAAAQREMLEETGLMFKNWRLIHVHQPLMKIEQFVAWYLATDMSAEQTRHLDNGEKIEVQYRDFKAIRDIAFDPEHPALTYAMPLFARFKTLNDLLNAPEFKGKEIDR